MHAHPPFFLYSVAAASGFFQRARRIKELFLFIKLEPSLSLSRPRADICLGIYLYIAQARESPLSSFLSLGRPKRCMYIYIVKSHAGVTSSACMYILTRMRSRYTYVRCALGKIRFLRCARIYRSLFYFMSQRASRLLLRL